MAKQEKDESQVSNIQTPSEKSQNDVISTLIVEYFKTKNNELDVLLRINEIWVDCFKNIGKDMFAQMQADRESRETMHLAEIENSHEIATKKLKLEKFDRGYQKKKNEFDVSKQENQCEGKINVQSLQEALKDSKEAFIDTSVDIAKKIKTTLKGDLVDKAVNSVSKKTNKNEIK